MPYVYKTTSNKDNNEKLIYFFLQRTRVEASTNKFCKKFQILYARAFSRRY